MDLSLEPMDGRDDPRLLAKAERETMLKRIKTIPDELFTALGPEGQREVQLFLYRLITLSMMIHQDMEDIKEKGDHEEHIVKLNARRRALFDELSPAASTFVHTVDIMAMEPWLEWTTLIHALQDDMHKEYYQTKNETGMDANNPFLMQVDNGSGDEMFDQQQNLSLTPADIETLILHFDLKTLIRQIMRARTIISGEFWQDIYDL